MLSIVEGNARAELYLRLLAERTLLDGTQRHPFGGPVLTAAEALAAVGAIEAELAEEIVGDFDLACYLRSRGGRPIFSRSRTAPAASQPVKLKPRRVVSCDAEVELSGWQVRIRYVLLGEDMTVLGVTATQKQAAGTGGPGQPFQAQLTDDQGHATGSGFSGGGSPGGLDGVLTAMTPLAADTRWIAVGGHRIDLSESSWDPPQARIEKLPETDSALGHLWRRLASNQRAMALNDEDLDAAIEALVHVGALDVASPDIAQLRTAAQMFAHAPHMRGHIPAMGANPPTVLPEPWASLAATMTRRSPQGPSGVLPVGAVTPSIDGTTAVMVEAVISNPDGFQIRVATTPAISIHPTAPWNEARIAWWAKDDRGGTYLGGIGNWGGSPDLSQGTVQFWPALDPRCKELTIMPTGTRERAVIAIALDWKRPR